MTRITLVHSLQLIHPSASKQTKLELSAPARRRLGFSLARPSLRPSAKSRGALVKQNVVSPDAKFETPLGENEVAASAKPTPRASDG